MSRSELLVAIVGLFCLEITHLKWIIWQYWDCRTCKVKNHVCGCKTKWMLYL